MSAADTAIPLAEKEQPVSGDSKRKRAKKFTPEMEMRHAFDLYSKRADVHGALELYDKVVREGDLMLQQHQYNVLLHLCSSASNSSASVKDTGCDKARLEWEGDDSGARLARRSSPACLGGGLETASTGLRELARTRGLEILRSMREAGVAPNEATLTAAARLAMAQGDGEQAFAFLREMQELGISPKLRSFGPALFTFCTQGRVDRAFAVDKCMQTAGVQPGEEELLALLRVCSEQGLADYVYAIIHRLRARLRALQPATLHCIEEWFQSAPASAATVTADAALDGSAVLAAMDANGGGWHGLGWRGSGNWHPRMARVDDDGICSGCHKQLATIDLDIEETRRFAKSLATLACERESRPNDFRLFQGWLDRHGPFDAIVDAANIGLCNQNYSAGGFNFHQLQAVVAAVQGQSNSGRLPLVVLHHRRTKGGPAAAPFAQKCLVKYREANAIYTTPTGSNDDWYWLYAAVHYRALLVTNDEMRDHLFQLLGTDFFPKWKERHQVRYSFSPKGHALHLPPRYSIVIQTMRYSFVLSLVRKECMSSDALLPRYSMRRSQ